MILEQFRFSHGTESTVSVLRVNGIAHSFVIEDERREVKVSGETRIPPGTYEIDLRPAGGMHQRYSEMFPEIHRGMLWLRNVPEFEWVYIHIGNSEADTAGCLLPNYGVTLDPVNGGGVGSRSTPAYLDLYRKIINAMDSCQEVFIHIENLGVKNG